jgi:hypothetical protein
MKNLIGEQKFNEMIAFLESEKQNETFKIEAPSKENIYQDYKYLNI